jgi:hypothetical protein
MVAIAAAEMRRSRSLSSSASPSDPSALLLGAKSRSTIRIEAPMLQAV